MLFPKTGSIYDLHDGYNQLFKNKFQVNLSLYEIIKMKDAGHISDFDIELCRILEKLKFASINQLDKMLKEDLSYIQTRADQLVGYRVLNKFVFTTGPENDYPMDKPLDLPPVIAKEEKQVIEGDCLVIYCLDMGAKTLLERYTNLDMENWLTSDNLMRAGGVAKKLLITDFYCNILTNTKEYEMTDFNVDRQFRIAKLLLTPDADVSLKKNNHKVSFILVVLKTEDFQEYFQNIIERYETLLGTNTWKKYFYEINEPPVVLFICEDKKTAERVGGYIDQCSELSRYRISTFDAVQNKKLAGAGSFMRYDKGKLQPIKASTFA